MGNPAGVIRDNDLHAITDMKIRNKTPLAKYKLTNNKKEILGKIILGNGIVLNPDNMMALFLTEHARYLRFNDVTCYISEDLKGVKEYVLYKKSNPIYSSQIAENVACYLDMLNLAKRRQ